MQTRSVKIKTGVRKEQPTKTFQHSESILNCLLIQDPGSKTVEVHPSVGLVILWFKTSCCKYRKKNPQDKSISEKRREFFTFK